jgi:hypothetical protein
VSFGAIFSPGWFDFGLRDWPAMLKVAQNLAVLAKFKGSDYAFPLVRRRAVAYRLEP